MKTNDQISHTNEVKKQFYTRTKLCMVECVWVFVIAFHTTHASISRHRHYDVPPSDNPSIDHSVSRGFVFISTPLFSYRRVPVTTPKMETLFCPLPQTRFAPHPSVGTHVRYLHCLLPLGEGCFLCVCVLWVAVTNKHFSFEILSFRNVKQKKTTKKTTPTTTTISFLHLRHGRFCCWEGSQSPQKTRPKRTLARGVSRAGGPFSYLPL